MRAAQAYRGARKTRADAPCKNNDDYARDDLVTIHTSRIAVKSSGSKRTDGSCCADQDDYYE